MTQRKIWKLDCCYSSIVRKTEFFQVNHLRNAAVATIFSRVYRANDPQSEFFSSPRASRCHSFRKVKQ